jgi:uncharacterized protein YegP (UPF0339 family)
MFEIYKDKAGEFRFRLKAKNGQIILKSEGYKTKGGCLNGAKSVRVNAINDIDGSSFKLYGGHNGPVSNLYFTMKARNGRTIGVSEVYNSASGLSAGIDSVLTNAPMAKIKCV